MKSISPSTRVGIGFLALALLLLLVTSVSAAPPVDFSNLDGVQVGDGSASAPSVSFTSDTDTGIFRGAANDLRFATGGTQRMAVTSSGLSISDGLTVSSGTVSVPTGAIGIAAVADISRTVSIPLHSFFECSTNAGASIPFSDGTDSHPNFANSSTDGLGDVISFDATAGSVDTDYICSDFVVPVDYAGTGATFIVKATKGAETATNSEVINCQASLNGAALLAAGTVTTSGTASAAYTCNATLTALAGGDAVHVTFHITSGGTADDTVNFQSVSFRYSATE